MPRMIVIGSSCAGKSTLSQKLSKELQCTYIQLDALNWLPNWVERDSADLLALLEEAVTQNEHWVLDGNYTRTQPVSWPRAEVVVWLNYPFRIVIWRALKRAFRRSFKGEILYSGNRETFRRTFLSRDSILWWLVHTFHRRRRKYTALFASGKYPHLHVIELRHPREAVHVGARIQAIYQKRSQ